MHATTGNLVEPITVPQRPQDEQRLLAALANKTRTILDLQDQLDLLSQCVDTFCELIREKRWDEASDLVETINRLTPGAATS